MRSPALVSSAALVVFAALTIGLVGCDVISPPDGPRREDFALAAARGDDAPPCDDEPACDPEEDEADGDEPPRVDPAARPLPPRWHAAWMDDAHP